MLRRISAAVAAALWVYVKVRSLALAVDALYDNGAPIAFTPVPKRQVFAFDDLGIPIDFVD